MAYAAVHYFSQALQKASSFLAVFPDAAEVARPWSVLYLLHGLSDDQSIWMRRSSIERYAAGLPLVVVMPDGGRGWYTNTPHGTPYEDDLLQDVRGLVERTFPVRTDRGGRSIGGLSMGGYGAIKLALKHPDLFGSAHSHSGALNCLHDHDVPGRVGAYEFPQVFGADPPSNRAEDPFALAESMDPARAPALWLDCGVDDFLLEHNRRFHAHLLERRIAHEYHEFEGGHDWAYWDCHVADALEFHARALNWPRVSSD